MESFPISLTQLQPRPVTLIFANVPDFYLHINIEGKENKPLSFFTNPDNNYEYFPSTLTLQSAKEVYSFEDAVALLRPYLGDWTENLTLHPFYRNGYKHYYATWTFTGEIMIDFLRLTSYLLLDRDSRVWVDDPKVSK